MPYTTWASADLITAAKLNNDNTIAVATDTARTITVTHTWTAAQTFTGGWTAAAACSVSDATDSTTSTTGSVTTAGGLGVAKALFAGTTINAGTGVTFTTTAKSVTALATPSALAATQFTAFASTVSGAALMGFGTTNDVALMNRAGTVVLGVGPNTTTVNMVGLLDLSGASAGQIKFPSTANASANVNTLDDYKEGSWVPTDASGAALSLTVSTCNYVKIGPVVFIWADITYPVTADGTAAKIGGLPYTVANVSSNRGGVVNFTDETTLKCFLPGNNTTTATLHDSVGVAVTNATMSTNRLIVSGMYQA